MKQRVSKKLLREAMALQDIPARPTESAKAPMLDELQHLCDKLKKTGDSESTQLLQQFIDDHRSVVVTARGSTKSDEELNIIFRIVEVDLDGLPQDSVLRDNNTVDNLHAIRVELEHQVTAKKAKVVMQPVLVTSRLNETVRCKEGGEFPVPATGADGKLHVEFREFGTRIEVLPTAINQNRLHLQTTCEFSHKDEKNALTLNGTLIPGLTTRRIQSNVDVNIGEANIVSCLHGTTGHKVFVITTVTKRN